MALPNATDHFIDAAEQLKEYYKKYCECDTAKGKVDCLAGIFRKKIDLLTEELKEVRLQLEARGTSGY
jgi:hypothetical protein